MTTSRREFLAGAVSAAALTSLPAAQKPADFVDVHAHFTPPQYVPEGFRAAAARFFYDVAQASNPTALGALRQVVPVRQIVFGTDYPFRTMQEHVEKLEAANVFSAAELHGVRRDNIARSLTRLLG